MAKADLTTVLDYLTFDAVKVDMKSADEYIDAHKATFGSLFYKPKGITLWSDLTGNSIECVTPSDLVLPDTSTSTVNIEAESWTAIAERLKRLAIIIKEKSDLFCQLEWLIRNIPVDNTKQSIDLIVKNLLYSSADLKAAYIEEGILYMVDKAPLLVLGFVAQIFKICDSPAIVSTLQTAVISHLFTELCHEVGWNIQLIIIRKLDDLTEIDKTHQVYPMLFNGLLPEVTGIVTERSDLDSAIDVFLNASEHPIPLTRILVQESVYKEFKDIMAWKCKSICEKTAEDMKININNDVFEYDYKLFLIDYVGDYTKNCTHVLVEAYKTTKELLTYIPKYKQLCLSIWASTIAEANEIALNVDVPIIWLNDYCNFIGSHEVIQPLYKRLDSVNITVEINNSVVQMMKKQEDWLKKTFTERCDAVLKVIHSKYLTLSEKIEPEIMNWKINNFITIENGTLILGFNIPDKIVIYNTIGTVAVPSPNFDNIIRALVNGSGVIIASTPKSEEEMFIAFEADGIPVAFVDDTETNGSEIIRVPLGDSWCFQTKVIWSNFGTTFAN